jgi:hypothetical protein
VKIASDDGVRCGASHIAPTVSILTVTLGSSIGSSSLTTGATGHWPARSDRSVITRNRPSTEGFRKNTLCQETSSRSSK